MNTEPTKEDLESLEFNAVWEAIKRWDIDRGNISTSNRCHYSGATGTDVMTILNALRSLKQLVRGE